MNAHKVDNRTIVSAGAACTKRVIIGRTQEIARGRAIYFCTHNAEVSFTYNAHGTCIFTMPYGTLTAFNAFVFIARQ